LLFYFEEKIALIFSSRNGDALSLLLLILEICMKQIPFVVSLDEFGLFFQPKIIPIA